MSEQNNLPVNPDSNTEPQPGVSSMSGVKRRSSLLRAALYAPVAVLLSGLAALATFPDLANYATPVIGESTTCSSGGCPIAALAAYLTGHQSEQQVPSCCSMSQSRATAILTSEQSGGCCMGISSCSSASESAATAEEPAAGPLTSTDDEPADATLVANEAAIETASN